MFENFNTIDFIILGILCLMNIACIICILILIFKNKKNVSVLDKATEVKVTKIEIDEKDKEPDTSAFDEIMEAMQKDLDASKENPVELFEQEQEEKAIISYQELLNAKNKTEPKKEIVEKIEETNNVEAKEEKSKAKPKLVTTKESKFTNSEFVSPVFGKVDKKSKTNIEVENVDKIDPHELEKTLNIEPLADEIKKNNEFLNALKEFRKNL